MIVAGTGHRPDKLGGYGNANARTSCIFLAHQYLVKIGATEAISGMAQGWDTFFALAALNAGLPLVAAVPFKGQETMWPDAAQDEYQSILKRATSVVYVCKGGYRRWKFLHRNEWMVNRCNRLLAMWDGTGGGTSHCVNYAAARGGIPIDNLWSEFHRP